MSKDRDWAVDEHEPHGDAASHAFRSRAAGIASAGDLDDWKVRVDADG